MKRRDRGVCCMKQTKRERDVCYCVDRRPKMINDYSYSTVLSTPKHASDSASMVGWNPLTLCQPWKAVGTLERHVAGANCARSETRSSLETAFDLFLGTNQSECFLGTNPSKCFPCTNQMHDQKNKLQPKRKLKQAVNTNTNTNSQIQANLSES